MSYIRLIWVIVTLKNYLTWLIFHDDYILRANTFNIENKFQEIRAYDTCTMFLAECRLLPLLYTKRLTVLLLAAPVISSWANGIVQRGVDWWCVRIISCRDSHRSHGMKRRPRRRTFPMMARPYVDYSNVKCTYSFIFRQWRKALQFHTKYGWNTRNQIIYASSEIVKLVINSWSSKIYHNSCY